MEHGQEITTRVKRNFVVLHLTIEYPEKFKPFEVKLPANVRRVTGIMVTASATWINSGP